MDSIAEFLSKPLSWIILAVIVVCIIILVGVISYYHTLRSFQVKKENKHTNSVIIDPEVSGTKPASPGSGLPAWHDIPVVVNIETIAGKMNWSLERYRAYLDVQKNEFLRAAPDFAAILYPEELILRWVRPLSHGHMWPIVLTDKRILYKVADMGDKRDYAIKGREIVSRWYANIVEVNPVWTGDLGSHIEGGGGYISGWVWDGTGGAWGQQNPIQTVQHHAECWVAVREQNGTGQKIPFRLIQNQNDVNIVKDFIDMFTRLVNIAWNKPETEYNNHVAALANDPKYNVTPIKTGEDTDFDKRAATLEKYAALKEKGLITEEEYNRQKKKILES